MSKIALLTRADEKTEADWLGLLRALMPAEDVVSFSTMTAEDRLQTEIAIVANPDPVQVSQLGQLKWIHSLWAGVERLVAELGTSAPPVVRLVDPELARVMAEAVLAWTYFLHREMPSYRRQQEKGLWQPLVYRHPSQVSIGVLGMGELGMAAAERLKDAGYSVSGWSRSPKSFDGIDGRHGEQGLVDMLGKTDILVCLLPLTQDTKGLLNAQRMAAMKKGASLINFARGPIVAELDLLKLLDARHLSHAVLDVFDTEPLPASSALWAHPQVTVLPHIAAPTNMSSAAGIVAGNIRSYRETGRIPQSVDLKRGY